MRKNIGLFWLKDDFRFKKNLALASATKNHDQVVCFYLYNSKKFETQNAQKWWVGKSLEEFRQKLSTYNINLEVLKIESYELFFEELYKRKNFSIYWNKTYEPSFLKLDNLLSKNFQKNSINFEIFKGNILNEFKDVKKSDGTPFKVFTPFWRNAERIYIEKIPSIEKTISKCKKKISFFKNTITPLQIFPKDKWYKKFEKYWSPSEENAMKELKLFINNNINNYSDYRNFPNITGTSRLSPFIKHGQIHVETIWNECVSIKKKALISF